MLVQVLEPKVKVVVAGKCWQMLANAGFKLLGLVLLMDAWCLGGG